MKAVRIISVLLFLCSAAANGAYAASVCVCSGTGNYCEDTVTGKVTFPCPSCDAACGGSGNTISAGSSSAATRPLDTQGLKYNFIPQNERGFPEYFNIPFQNNEELKKKFREAQEERLRVLLALLKAQQQAKEEGWDEAELRELKDMIKDAEAKAKQSFDDWKKDQEKERQQREAMEQMQKKQEALQAAYLKKEQEEKKAREEEEFERREKERLERSQREAKEKREAIKQKAELLKKTGETEKEYWDRKTREHAAANQKAKEEMLKGLMERAKNYQAQDKNLSSKDALNKALKDINQE